MVNIVAEMSKHEAETELKEGGLIILGCCTTDSSPVVVCEPCWDRCHNKCPMSRHSNPDKGKVDAE